MIAGVYKCWPLDILESMIHFNLILFASSTMYITETGGKQAILANVSLSIIFITFILIIGYQVLALLFPEKATAFINRLNRNGQRTVSISDYLDELDHDDHHLIDYTAAKKDEESDCMSVASNAKESTY